MANKEDIQRFLHYISQIESSGGKNLDHPIIEKGRHAGTSAQGQYGVMPDTMTNLEDRHPSSFTDTSTPDDYAKVYANDVLNKAKGDETLAAGLWTNGQFTKPEKYEDIRSYPYAQKYDKMRKEIPYALDANPYQEKFEDEQEQKQNPDTFRLLKGLVRK